MIYRIIITVGYADLKFDFPNSNAAVQFAQVATTAYKPTINENGKSEKFEMIMKFIVEEERDGVFDGTDK